MDAPAGRERAPGPLAGVRVLEFAQLFPGPYAGLVLAELGAEVIKVEPPDGDPTRMVPPFVGASGGGAGAVFCALNRGKSSVVLDLKAGDGAGVEAYHRLAATCRIVLDGYRAGVADRLGVGFEALAVDRDDLVYVTLTGFGPDGPRAGEPGHDVTYQGWAGALDPSGPAMPNVPTADATSALWAALMAVAHLGAPGNHRVDTSLVGALAAPLFMARAMAVAEPGFDDPVRRGNAGYNVYACGDGRLLALGALEPHFWERLCEVLDDDELSELGHPAQGIVGPAIEAVAAHLATDRREAWIERFEAAGVPCAPVLDVLEALDGLPGITGPGARSPPDVAGAEHLKGAPALGEHTKAVLDAL